MPLRTLVRRTAISSLLLAGAASSVLADAQIGSSAIHWDADPALRYTLTVSGGGQVERYVFDTGEPASLGLIDADGEILSDGSYTWQLVGAPEITDGDRQAFHQGKRAVAQGTTESGSFSIAQGAFVVPTTTAGDRDTLSLTKVQQIEDDLSVKGSACIGFDCTSLESFGFDTLRFKENNLRIGFIDTSEEPTFPSNDWQIHINSPSNGGANYFAIVDDTADQTPFLIEAGARDNAIYVDDAGQVGLGTATPARSLHLLEGNTPGLRLEQDGSSGFAAQIWDVAGNETNFFVRDVTANLLPFVIEPGAPRDSLRIMADGSVALGTSNPVGRLHLENAPATDADDMVVTDQGYIGLGTTDPRRPLHIVADGNPHVAFEHSTAAVRWNVGTNSSGGFIVSQGNTGGKELEIDPAGNITFRKGSQVLATLDANGNLTTNGTLTTAGNTCGGGCDKVFQPGYKLESIEDHAESMWKNSYLPAVGPTVENGDWNLSEKTGGMLNELEKAHIYIEQLNAKIGELSQRLERLETSR
ncbi:MAG: hypothetical protein AAF657_21320 [Acidobacteriota bacterium]